jgi:hypothetical protein
MHLRLAPLGQEGHSDPLARLRIDVACAQADIQAALSVPGARRPVSSAGGAIGAAGRREDEGPAPARP